MVLDAVVDYLPCPTDVKPQPLTDEDGKRMASSPLYLPKNLSRHWPLKLWMTALAL